MRSRIELEQFLRQQLAALLGIAAAQVDPKRDFFSYGLESTAIIPMAGDLEVWLGHRLSPTLLFEHPTIDALSAHLAGSKSPTVPVASLDGDTKLPTQESAEPIAIVGVSCRYPGARDAAEYWRLLADGVDAVSEVPSERWDSNQFFGTDPEAPGKTRSRWGGFVEGVADFDAAFFGITAREADRIDPQQRMALEVAWEALENAGELPSELEGTRAGVFVGVSHTEYSRIQFRQHALVDGYAAAGNSLSLVANRISYALDLRGPSFAVDTACSSSLVALHLACESLRRRESTLAIVLGANLTAVPEASIALSKAGLLAPDGRCKPFDQRANGYVRGEGVGAVVLKPLSAAIRDGNAVLATIRGSAITQDGKSNGLMAPNQRAQEEAIRAACRHAGISPGVIDYVEAHGTGTYLGDAIEATALGNVVGDGRAAGAPCVIGSVKSNIGHLESASGIASIIKVVLALGHQQIPASLHFEEPNQQIDFEGLRLRVQTALGAWPYRGRPRLAGVNAFGFGGANAHVLLEEFQATPADLAEAARFAVPRAELIMLSARSRASLSSLARSIHLQLGSTAQPGEAGVETPSIYGIARTLALHRCHHHERVAFVSRDRDELGRQLAAVDNGRATERVYSGTKSLEPPLGVCFVFSGQGVHELPAIAGALGRFPVFAEALAACDDGFARWGRPPIAAGGWGEGPGRLHDTDSAQPLIFSLQIATARLLESWGVHPACVLGHSVGEVAAAVICGALSLEDACAVVFHRSRLMQQLKGRGGMLALRCSDREVLPFLEGRTPRIGIAAVNSPRSVVLSGARDLLATVQEEAFERGIGASMLHVDFPFHSQELSDELESLEDAIRHVSPGPEKIPMVSSVSGERITGHLLDASYWRRNASEPVCFAAAVTTAAARGCNLFIELSPQPLLVRNVKECLGETPARSLASYQNAKLGEESLLELGAALYASGIDLNHAALFPKPARVVPLPSRPWQHKRHWFHVPVQPELPPREQTGLLGAHVELVHAPGAHVFSRDTDLESLGAGVPGWSRSDEASSLLVEMLVRAAREAGIALPLVLSEITLAPLPSGPFSLQTAVLPQWPGRWVVDVHVRQTQGAANSAEFVRCAQAYVSSVPQHATAPAPARLESGPELGWSEMGDLPQSVREVRQHAEGVHLRLELPALAGPSGAIAVALEACRRVVVAAGGRIGVPYVHEVGAVERMQQVTVRSVLAEHVQADVRWRTLREGALPAFEIALGDASDALVEFSGVEFATCEPETVPQDLLTQDLSFADLVWRQTPLPLSLAASSVQGTWLILSDRTGVGAAIARLLTARGRRSKLVHLAQSGTSHGTGDTVDWGSEAALRSLLDETAKRGGLSGVVACSMLDVGPFDITSPAALEHAQVHGCESAVEVVKALHRAGGSRPPRVWLLTRGARSVLPEDDALLSVGQAPLWGLGRGVDQELPDYRCSLVDLDPGAADFGASSVVDELLANDDEREIAFRNQARYVLRLRERKPPQPIQALVLEPNASYVVTGGLGGIGFEVVRWLVERGAKSLLLVGRSAPSVARSEDLARLRERGVRCKVLCADVADYGQLERVLAAAAETVPAIRGVVHAAGVVDSRAFTDLSRSSLARVFAPKVSGTCNLYRLTHTARLDFFVMFSSVSSVLGTPGQANYNAANLFMDMFAHWARANGTRAISINWGPWADVGMLAGTSIELVKKAAEQRVKLISPSKGVGVLERLIQHAPAQFSVMPWDLRTLLEHYPAGASRCLFRDLNVESAAGLAPKLSQASLSERPLLRQEYVAPETDTERVVAEVWRRYLKLDRIGVLDNFFELGGDSILGSQIIAELNRRFGIALDIRESFGAFTIKEVSQAVLARLEAKLAELSDAEVERLLQESQGA